MVFIWSFMHDTTSIQETFLTKFSRIFDAFTCRKSCRKCFMVTTRISVPVATYIDGILIHTITMVNYSLPKCTVSIYYYGKGGMNKLY